TGVRSSDFFGYASGVADGRYEGLVAGELFDAGQVTLDGHSVLVRPEIALRQLEEDAAKARSLVSTRPDDTDQPGNAAATGLRGSTGSASATDEGAGKTIAPPAPALLRRYHGSVTIDTTRIVRDASAIADGVIQHLTKVEGARVRVAIEIEAEMPAGAPDDVVRTVMENGRTLKFRSSGFEES
ncbi:MAG: AAA+ family ATPase, partial [Chloroflexota bacterium]|nr:AAA+ family ATPase [Chloroflexota bacterium]